MTRGRCGSLALQRVELSSTTPRRCDRREGDGYGKVIACCAIIRAVDDPDFSSAGALRTCRESALRNNRGARAVRQLLGDQATVIRRNAPAHVVLIRCGDDRYVYHTAGC